MKIIIYRPSETEQHRCAVALLGLPSWVTSEFLRRAALLDEPSAGSPTEDTWKPGRTWSSFAIEPDDTEPEPGYLRTDPLSPTVGDDQGDDSGEALSTANDEDAFPDHHAGYVCVMLHGWGADAPLSEMLGNGWWRFLSPDGTTRLLDAEGEGIPPRLMLSRRDVRRVAILGQGLDLGWSSSLLEARIQLADGADGSSIAGIYFTTDMPIDKLGCTILQSLAEVTHLVAVGCTRTPAPPAGDDTPQLRLTLLFADAEPDSSEAPPDEAASDEA